MFFPERRSIVVDVIIVSTFQISGEPNETLNLRFAKYFCEQKIRHVFRLSKMKASAKTQNTFFTKRLVFEFNRLYKTVIWRVIDFLF